MKCSASLLGSYAARYRREAALSKAQADLAALDRRRAELQRMLGRAAQD